MLRFGRESWHQGKLQLPLLRYRGTQGHFITVMYAVQCLDRQPLST